MKRPGVALSTLRLDQYQFVLGVPSVECPTCGRMCTLERGVIRKHNRPDDADREFEEALGMSRRCSGSGTPVVVDVSREVWERRALPRRPVGSHGRCRR